MASNFRILSHETRDSLHLKLTGDFDGNSAHELINTLIERGIGFYQIFMINPQNTPPFMAGMNAVGGRGDAIPLHALIRCPAF